MSARVDLPCRDSGGRLPEFAWPGGYPVVYVTSDGEVLCGKCVNGENGAEPTFEDPEDRSGWRVDGYQIHYEGPPEVCCHCGTEIESAYGDPDAEEDEG